MTDILSIKGLRKVSGDVTAVDGISFEVRPKEMVGLFGPNREGKMTTIGRGLGVLQAGCRDHAD